MAQRRLTALWWWIDRWRKSTAYMDMTLEEQGAYRNLLDEASLRGGPLPNDERVLAKACGDARRWSKVRAAVMARFELQEDGWHNDTLDEVVARSLSISEARSIAGKAGNKSRWESQKASQIESQTPSQTGSQKASLPYPYPDPYKEQKKEKEPASLSPPADPRRDPFTDADITARAGAFIDRYQSLYPKHRKGALYAVKPVRDYAAAVTLCQTWPDERLDKLAVIFLTTDHKFAEEGSRTIPQFLALASWADGRLAEHESKHGAVA